MNFGLWWDGDVQRELLDGTKLDKWNSSTNSVGRLFTFYNFGTATHINGTKANPNLPADILGDWREEAIFRSSDNTKLLIFTTVIPASNRFYTFMHDPQYRCQVAGQNSAYKQPPHPSFYFGGGMAAPPPPNIFLAGSTGGGETTLSGTYTITARDSGKALDVEARSLADGGNVLQWTVNSGNNQKWSFTYLADSYYRITNLNSGKALEVADASTTNGGNVQQWAWTGAYNQHWQVNDLGGGYYSLINRDSGKAIDITGASTADGANAVQYTYSGSTNQQFGLSISSSATAAIANRVSVEGAIEHGSVQPMVYPNPSSGAININLSGPFTYRIVDQLGKEYEKGRSTNKAWIGQKLAAGIYFITIETRGKVQTTKIVKVVRSEA